MIIAEIGLTHEGSLGSAHSYIDALAETGIDAIKFQTHIAEAESSEKEKFRVPFSKQDRSRMDYWKRTSFKENEWLGLKSHCEDMNINFLSTPSCLAAVDLLEKLNVSYYKVGSGDTSNHLLLNRIGETKKPILLSTGMSTLDEIESSIKLLKHFKNPITLMQCTSKYPTNPEDWGLNLIQKFEQYFNIPVGFSDHSGTIYPCLAAAALGAKAFEFHVVFDRNQFGPDVSSSITVNEVKTLTNGIRSITTSLKNPINKDDISRYKSLRKLFGKSLSINKNKKSGDKIYISDLESKKPLGQGIPAKDFKTLIGKKLNKNLKKWSFIKGEDID